eukprot:TRINITY_DN16230_c0_g1_i1.p2 TRINITY_DN16230_c0_g1~~TRINITY_DN16230_c0_g1_i1.p2  ORF type:complete len:112 (-),score=17.34 TRINITY_DN16230_c0_g1_i1:175-510(-)
METECKNRKHCCRTFKLILMDINMPIMDGIEATKILRAKMKDQELPNTIIIACTAQVSDEQKKLCFEAGMNDFLCKPLNHNSINRILLGCEQLYQIHSRRELPSMDNSCLN